MVKYATFVSVRIVQCALEKAQILCWPRMLAAPLLTPKHKEARILWAKDMFVQAS